MWRLYAILSALFAALTSIFAKVGLQDINSDLATAIRTTIILWSLLTCYSRIYLGVHYVGDIGGGLCVGIVCALMVHYCYRRFVRPSQQIPVQTKEPWLIISAIIATVIYIGTSYFF